ncbi:hypothetical protein PHLGIDRAFT_118621 [Phlebiopsis gigantea 11061_1 CR5-6]|uniref:Uncharacterized protein n=1 Tax=Phlebiopsis gigantea (strain 11061_1 CR5-6) TaxID=745531 RepID=A0A0C3RXZ2_PHLG1|nr:hypothetical protein PHLGIDRAFT_118621 [Phlebiopsis gigantea 11061_1 CR5-6]
MLGKLRHPPRKPRHLHRKTPATIDEELNDQEEEAELRRNSIEEFDEVLEDFARLRTIDRSKSPLEIPHSHPDSESVETRMKWACDQRGVDSSKFVEFTKRRQPGQDIPKICCPLCPDQKTMNGDKKTVGRHLRSKVHLAYFAERLWMSLENLMGTDVCAPMTKRQDAVHRHQKICPSRHDSGYSLARQRRRGTKSKRGRKAAHFDRSESPLHAPKPERHYATDLETKSQDDDNDDSWCTESDQPYDLPEEQTSIRHAIQQRGALSPQQRRHDRLRPYNNSMAHREDFQNLHRLIDDAMSLHNTLNENTGPDVYCRSPCDTPSETSNTDPEEAGEDPRDTPMDDEELSPSSGPTDPDQVGEAVDPGPESEEEF